MFLVIFLLAFIWIAQRNKPTVTSAAARTGGRHSPVQTAQLGGWNMLGNTWDNGTASGTLNPQWSGYDAPIGNLTFAIEGGEDGGDPSQPSLMVPSSQVISLPRFRLLGGGESDPLPSVPVRITALSPVVRRA